MNRLFAMVGGLSIHATFAAAVLGTVITAARGYPLALPAATIARYGAGAVQAGVAILLAAAAAATTVRPTSADRPPEAMTSGSPSRSGFPAVARPADVKRICRVGTLAQSWSSA
jgi:hypothetical protein